MDILIEHENEAKLLKKQKKLKKLAGDAEYTLLNKIPLNTSYREIFLKKAKEYIV